MKFFINFILILFFLLVSCSDYSTNPSSNKVIMPLAVGNLWIYKDIHFNESGNITGTSFDTVSVIDEEFIKSEKVYDVIMCNMVYTLSNRNDGLYFVLTYYEPWLIYKYPGKSGDYFLSNYGLGNIASTNAIISIAIGNFKCYKYKFERSIENGSTTTQITYASPGIGEIYSEYTYFDSFRDITYLMEKSELISYILK